MFVIYVYLLSNAMEIYQMYKDKYIMNVTDEGLTLILRDEEPEVLNELEKRKMIKRISKIQV